MEDTLLSMTAWVYLYRKPILRVSDMCLAGTVWCFLIYFMGATIIGGQNILRADLRDTVISDSIKLQGQQDRQERMDATQTRQWAAINQLQTDSATFKAQVAELTAGQESVTHILYVILAAIVLKSVIDVLRDNQKPRYKQHPEPEYD